jgi:hypothetical protein
MAKAATKTQAPAATKANAVAKTGEALPAFMQGKAGQGVENISNTEAEIPRIKLIQGMSPELEIYNDLKAGHFFHTLTEEDLGPELRIVPIYVDVRFILWRPRDDGGGILARADDGIHWHPADVAFTVKLDKRDGGDTVTWKTAKTVTQSRLADWGTMNPKDKDSPPAATKMYNVVAGFPDHPDWPPGVITLQRSSIKVGRRLLGKLKITRAPSYGLIFKMGVIREGDGKNQFNNYSFVGDGMIQDEDYFNQCETMYKMFKEQGLAIRDLEGIGDEDAGGDEEPEADDGKKRPAY